ncbi:MAG TPA: hypothetical protein VGN88_13705 [Phycisphaerae bacterium]|jgi:hypothetical protein
MTIRRAPAAKSSTAESSAPETAAALGGENNVRTADIIVVENGVDIADQFPKVILNNKWD